MGCPETRDKLACNPINVKAAAESGNYEQDKSTVGQILGGIGSMEMRMTQGWCRLALTARAHGGWNNSDVSEQGVTVNLVGTNFN